MGTSNFKDYIALTISLTAALILSAPIQQYFALNKEKKLITYNKKIKLQEQAELQKLLQAQIDKVSLPTVENPRIKFILSHHHIMIEGALGAGKTLLANFLANCNVTMVLNDFNERLRYFKYIDPNYYLELNKLLSSSKLPLYCDGVTFKSHDDFECLELWPVLTQMEKGIYKGTGVVDEAGSKLGTDQYWKQLSSKDDAYKNIDDFSRFMRQTLEFVIIWIEQNGKNQWKPIKDKGMFYITAKGVESWTQKAGVKKFKQKKFFIGFLPAFCTLNSKKILQQNNLFFWQYVKTFFKLLITPYLSFPQKYYVKIVQVLRKIKFKYDKIKIKYSLDNNDKKQDANSTRTNFTKYDYFILENKNLYIYNTHAKKSDYDKQFDKTGKRIGVNQNEKKQKQKTGIKKTKKTKK